MEDRPPCSAIRSPDLHDPPDPRRVRGAAAQPAVAVLGTAHRRAAPTVLIGGKPAAVMGSRASTPPHVGLHPSDPLMVPTVQQGTVVAGSPRC